MKQISISDILRGENTEEKIVVGAQMQVPKAFISKTLLEKMTKDLTVKEIIPTIKKYDEETGAIRETHFTNKIPNTFRLLEDAGDYYMIPRSYGFSIFKNYEYLDLMTDAFLPESEQYNFAGTLRDYQIPIVDSIKDKIKEGKTSLMLRLDTGFGKTPIALYLTAMLNRKAIIFVDREILFEQWIDAIIKFTHIRPGVIHRQKIDCSKPITIAMVQSFHRKEFSDEILNGWGVVVFDEAKSLPASSYINIVKDLPARYRVMLCADFKRTDGLLEITHLHAGKETVNGVLMRTGIAYIVQIASGLNEKHFHYVDYKTGNLTFSDIKCKKVFLNNRKVLSKFIDLIANRYLTDKSRTILVVLPFRDSVKFAKQDMEKKLYGVCIQSIMGNATKKERESIKDAQIIVTTDKYLDKGYDNDKIDTAFLFNQGSNPYQILGRLRKGQMKNELQIIDFRVTDISEYKNRIERVRRIYEKAGFVSNIMDAESFSFIAKE